MVLRVGTLMVEIVVGEDGRSDPNRNIYRVLDDDYVSPNVRMAAEEEPQFNPHSMQARVPVGGTDIYDVPRGRGSGMKAVAVIVAFLVVALMISVALVSGWISFEWGSAPDLSKKVVVKDPEIGHFYTLLPFEGSEFTINNITLVWSPAENATSYEIMLDSSPYFVSPDKDLRTNLTVCSLNMTDGTYYWKVRALGDNSTSNWTRSNTFSIKTAIEIVQLMLPSKDAVTTNASVMFTWSTVDLATIYQLQVDNNNDFSSPLIDVLTRASNCQTSELETSTSYYWRVQASNDGHHSAWSEVREVARGFEYLIRTYSWNVLDETFTATLNLSGADYYQFEQRARTYDYGNYVVKTDSAILSLAKQINDQANAKGLNIPQWKMQAALAFVQSIPYVLDNVSKGVQDYARYPIESLVDNGGDCECKSILFASLTGASPLNYNTVMLRYANQTVGHMAVGLDVHDNTYPSMLTYQHNGIKYWYCETTTPLPMGFTPADMYTWNLIDIIDY